MDWRGFRWSSLKARTTLFTLGLFLGSLWSLYLYANHLLREEMSRASSERQRSTASVVATAIDHELDSRFQALHKAAKIVSPLMSDSASLQAALDASSFLLHLFNGGIIVTGPDGTAIGDLPRSTGRVGQFYGRDEWISTALRKGRASVSRPLIGQVLHVPVFAMTVPVLDRRATAIGTLSGVVALDESTFLDAIASNRYGKGGRFLLVDPRYRLVVTASDKRFVMQGISAAGGRPEVDRLLDGHGGTSVLVNRFDEEVLDTSSLIPTSGWYFVVSLPTREAFAPIRTLQQRILLATLLLTAVAGCLTWWMLRHQLAPLTNAVALLARSSGDNPPVEALPVARQDEVGELIGGFNRLLAALQKREEALRESHETLTSILATTRDGYWHADRHGRLLDVNDTYTQLSRYTREELLGMKISDLEAAEHHGDVASHLQRVAASGGDLFESQHRRKDGSIWDVEVSVTCRDVDGGQYVAFIRDLTERKRMAQALLTAQKLESLGTLAGGVAHHFNNILTAVVGNANLATLEVGPDHPAAESLEEISKASARAAELVRRLVVFGRPAATKPQAVDLRAVLGETLELLRCALPAGVDLRTELADDAPQVLADAGQVHEVVVNLTTNAAYALGGRTGWIEYRLEPAQVGSDLAPILSVGEGRYARLTVTDSGCGMDADTRARIFDAFYTTKPVGEGTGLGLSMVHGTMRAHGGTVTVESTPGEGSRFALYFPAAVEEASDEAPHLAEPQGGCSGGQRVLFVDDEEAIVSLAERTLSRMGHQIRGFTDPNKALGAFRSRPQDFDVLVTDLSMPHLSGFDLARQIHEVRPELPVVVVTGRLTPEHERLAAEVGVRESLVKPVQMDQLGRVLGGISSTHWAR